MAKKYSQGIYTVKYPAKYIGPNVNKVTFRSSWESTMCQFLDSGNPSILGWSSESISIPYMHPFLRKIKMYIPDFFVVWLDSKNKQQAAIFEIKPSKENPWANPGAKCPPKLQAIRIVNDAKWRAALVYCAQRKIQFRIITEKDLFAFKK